MTNDIGTFAEELEAAVKETYPNLRVSNRIYEGRDDLSMIAVFDENLINTVKGYWYYDHNDCCIARFVFRNDYIGFSIYPFLRCCVRGSERIISTTAQSIEYECGLSPKIKDLAYKYLTSVTWLNTHDHFGSIEEIVKTLNDISNSMSKQYFAVKANMQLNSFKKAINE